MLLAQRFPRSSFRGGDTDPQAVSEAQAEAARRGLKNVTFTCADAPHLLEEPGSADLILAFWSERAIAAASAWSPATLRAAKEALVPSGTLIARGLRLMVGGVREVADEEPPAPGAAALGA